MERRRHQRYFRSLRHTPRTSRASTASANQQQSTPASATGQPAAAQPAAAQPAAAAVAELHKMYMETKIKMVSGNYISLIRLYPHRRNRFG